MASDNEQEVVSGTSETAIIACNAISVAACILVLILYLILRRWTCYERVMKRTSLVIAACMAAADLVLHSANLAGYNPNLTHSGSFVCAFVGGWLYAFPTLVSIIYSCCIAFNTQLVFVFGRSVGASERLVKIFIWGPIVFSGIICFSALGAKVYGYDNSWGYCWYASPPAEEITPAQSKRLILSMVFTYAGWCILSFVYLVFAGVTISWMVFGSGNGLGRGRWREPSTKTQQSRDHELAIDMASDPAYLHSPPTSPRPDRLKHGRQTPRTITSVTDTPLANLTLTDNESLDFDGTPRYSKRPHSGVSGVYDDEPPQEQQPQQGDQQRVPKAAMVLGYGRPSTSYPPNRHINTNNNNSNQAPKTLSPRALALRALTLRLIGYILIPIFCILPSVILDLWSKVDPNIKVPESVNGLLDGLNGLIGVFNAALMLGDPGLVVVWMEIWRKRKSKSKSTTVDKEANDEIQDRHDRGEEGEDMTNIARTVLEWSRNTTKSDNEPQVIVHPPTKAHTYTHTPGKNTLFPPPPLITANSSPVGLPPDFAERGFSTLKVVSTPSETGNRTRLQKKNKRGNKPILPRFGTGESFGSSSTTIGGGGGGGGAELLIRVERTVVVRTEVEQFGDWFDGL